MAYRNWKGELEDTRPDKQSNMPFIIRLVAVGVTLMVLTAVALWGYPGYLLPKKWVRPGPAPDNIAILFSSDIQGYYEPCGCTEILKGGIARASGYISTIDKPKTRILVDLGNMTAGPQKWQQIGLRTYLEALGKMKYSAVNIGANELTLPAADLQNIIKTSPVEFISANVQTKDGTPLAKPYRQLFVNNLRITLVGVFQQHGEDELNKQFKISDINQTLSNLLPSLRKNTDVIVLLAACDDAKIQEIANSHPEIDIILGGRVQQASRQIKQIGDCWVASHADKGNLIGLVNVDITDDGVVAKSTSHMQVLEESQGAPVDKRFAQMVEDYNAELARLNREEGLKAWGIPIRPAPADAGKYVGSATCMGCHPKAYAVWKKSDHAKAYSSLVRRKRASNPGCVKCHVLDLGAADGFVGLTRSPGRINVQCESCHGRGSAHVAARSQGLSKDIGKFTPVMENSCVICHDCKHSPEFEFNKYWEPIKHGKE